VRRSPRTARPARRALALVVAGVTLLAACGDDSTSSDTTDATGAPSSAPAGTDAPPAGGSSSLDDCSTLPTLTKPSVEHPGDAPEELVVTDIETGEGPEAREGDTIVVHYVGVRSLDGVEFDNSYDRGQPFQVTLGQGMVIPGWDQGLVGMQAGGVRQLDIPAELAYGETSRSEVIRENEPLTFLVEAVAVLPVTDPADAPEVDVEATENVDALVIDDLVVGEGAEVQPCQTVALHLIAYSAADAEELASSWETGQLQPIPYRTDGSLPGLIEALDGMRIGGRRFVQIPFDDAFGPTGNADFGLPGSTDMLLVIDVIAAY
jgi:peptidylprolyl isomerase